MNYFKQLQKKKLGERQKTEEIEDNGEDYVAEKVEHKEDKKMSQKRKKAGIFHH